MKILLVKTSSLGDIIQCFPILDYLKVRFPNSQIDWVVENSFAELVKAHPYVSNVFAIDSKKWRKYLLQRRTWQYFADFRQKMREQYYDFLFDLQGNIKSGLVVSQCLAKQKIGFGWSAVPEWPNVLFTKHHVCPSPDQNIRLDYLSVVKRYFQDETPYVPKSFFLNLKPLEEQELASLFQSQKSKPTLVCPFAAWTNKCLSESTLIKFLKSLKKAPYWFIWGNHQERTIAVRTASHFPESLVLKKLTIPLLQHVMSRCSLVVAMDSLPLHLCGTTATPSFSFFGPSSGKKYVPLGKQHFFLQGECPYGVKFEKRCPKLRTCQTGLCLKEFRNIKGSTETE
jgi:heptosyltransferase I